jgi:hypothetical protein
MTRGIYLMIVRNLLKTHKVTFYNTYSINFYIELAIIFVVLFDEDLIKNKLSNNED